MAAAKGKMAKRVGIVLAVVAITIIAACAWYVNDSSDADESALAAIAGEGAYGAETMRAAILSDALAEKFKGRRPVIPDQTQGRNCMDHAEYMQEKCRILSGGNGRRSLYVE